MPMKRHLYPSNWDTIAFIIKSFADWRCKRCGRPCRRPGQTWDEFVTQYDDPNNEWDDLSKPGRFVLTVAHSRDNLKALCPTCHNRHDAKARAINRSHTRMVKLENAGQLRITGLEQ